MKQKVYLDPDGGRHHVLPGIWNNTSPITEDYLLANGWTAAEEEVQEPGISPALAAKEAAFASAMKQAAASLSVDLAGLPEINVQALMAAAAAAGADETTIGLLAAKLSALYLDILAETYQSPADTWRGLKSRLPGYLND